MADVGRAPTGQALAVPATPLRVDGPSGFDPSRITEAVQAVEPRLLEPIIKRAADNFYEQMLAATEDHLRDNLDWNITSHISMLERENQRMRTELFEVDRALGCMSLGHATRIAAIEETQRRANRANAEVWRLRAILSASGIEAPSGGETGNTGSTEGESPTGEAGDAQND